MQLPQTSAAYPRTISGAPIKRRGKNILYERSIQQYNTTRCRYQARNGRTGTAPRGCSPLRNRSAIRHGAIRLRSAHRDVRVPTMRPARPWIQSGHDAARRLQAPSRGDRSGADRPRSRSRYPLPPEAGRGLQTRVAGGQHHAAPTLRPTGLAAHRGQRRPADSAMIAGAPANPTPRMRAAGEALPVRQRARGDRPPPAARRRRGNRCRGGPRCGPRSPARW